MYKWVKVSECRDGVTYTANERVLIADEVVRILKDVSEKLDDCRIAHEKEALEALND